MDKASSGRPRFGLLGFAWRVILLCESHCNCCAVLAAAATLHCLYDQICALPCTWRAWYDHRPAHIHILGLALLCFSHAHIRQSILFIPLIHPSNPSLHPSILPRHPPSICHAAYGVSPTTCSVRLHNAAPDLRPCRTPYILKETGRPCGCPLSFFDLRVIRDFLVIVSVHV